MSKSYFIQWKSSINGRAGRGSKVFEFEEAARLSEELNREYPGIHHEPVEANVQPEPIAMDQQTESAEPMEAAPEPSQVVLNPDFAFPA